MKWNNQIAQSRIKLFGGLALAAALSFSQSAWAVGTASNTTISNTATLNYTVGGTAQAAIGSSATGNTTGAGTATTFLVDKKVNLTVLEVGSTPTTVAPGQVGAVTTFTVTNTGNDPQDFSLAAANLANGTTIFNNTTTLTDNFDSAAACTTFVENGLAPGYQATGVNADTGTFIDELVANGAGSTATVYVVCNIPAAQANNSVAIVELTAVARIGGTAGGAIGGALTNNTASVNTAAVDNVFADPATAAVSADGTIPVQIASDATGIARDAYKVSAAVLSVAKTATLICDPVAGGAPATTQHNIPGAVVRWTITISNAAGAGSANLATVADAIDVTNTTVDPNLITGAGALPNSCLSALGTPENAAGRGFKLSTTSLRPPASYPKFLTTTSSVDGADFVTPNVGIDYAVALPAEVNGVNTYTAGELKGGESVTVYFNVTIN